MARVWQFLVVTFILITGVGLLCTAILRVRDATAWTQSYGNLGQITLSFHSFHDVNKRLPFNGVTAASTLAKPQDVAKVPWGVPAIGDPTTGSWIYQVLPYIDEMSLFNSPPTGLTAHPASLKVAIPGFLCPGRGRPPVSTTGAWSDYCINPWINDPVNGKENAPDARRPVGEITDGTANTIFVGHGAIDPNMYSSHIVFAQSTDIFRGGDPATARRSTINQMDKQSDGSLTWGSAFTYGAAMGMGDASVRIFRYNISGAVITNGVSTSPGLGAFLTPAGGEFVEVPKRPGEL